MSCSESQQEAKPCVPDPGRSGETQNKVEFLSGATVVALMSVVVLKATWFWDFLASEISREGGRV